MTVGPELSKIHSRLGRFSVKVSDFQLRILGTESTPYPDALFTLQNAPLLTPPSPLQKFHSASQSRIMRTPDRGKV